MDVTKSEDTHLTRECRPPSDLTKSYYHSTCEEPLSGANACDILDKKTLEAPDRVAFRVPEFQQQLTLEELKEKADKLSKALLHAGLQKGDVVFLVDVADINFFVWFFASLRIGLIFLCPQIDEPKEKDTQIYCNEKPACVCLGNQHKPASRDVIREYAKNSQKNIPVVVLTEGLDHGNFTSYSEFLACGSSVSDEDLLSASLRVSVDDIACLFPSSGTTSEHHKIACLTQHSLVNMAVFCYQRVNPFHTKDVFSVLNPTVDDAGCILTTLLTVYNDCVSVMSPSTLVPGQPASVDVFLHMVNQEKITWHCGLPFELINALKSPNKDNYDLSSLRGGYLLGQVVSEESKRKLLDTFPDMVTLFGGTEAFAGLGSSAKWSTYEQRLSSIGFGFPHLEIKIANGQDEIVPIGQEGEICVRGWSVFKEYYHDPVLTAQAKHVDKNGWCHYGDIAVMDATGHVTYVGRKSECVRYKHYSDTVYPSNILSAVAKDARIAHAKVLGLQNDEVGDDICLCVEPREGCTVTEEELKVLMEHELLENIRPDFYFVFDKFPRTGSRLKISLVELKKVVSEQLKKMEHTG